MTIVDATVIPGRSSIRARRASFFEDMSSIAGRALRSIVREPEFVLPAIVIPLSTKSAASSGSANSSVRVTASMICVTGS